MRKAYPLYHGSQQQPYSKGVVAEGRFVFLAGCGGTDPETDMVPSTILKQMEVTWNKLKARLEEMGTSCENIVHTLQCVTDIEEYQQARDIFREPWMKKNCPRLLEERIPDMLVEVARLAKPQMKYEIQVIAVIPEPGSSRVEP